MAARSTDPGEDERKVRIDRWLNAARIFPGRPEASEACDGGKVHLNGSAVKPSRPVGAGDELKVTTRQGERLLRVLAVEEKRQSPKRARELYEDHTPPPPKERELERMTMPRRDRGQGRPTKRDRRRLDRWSED